MVILAQKRSAKWLLYGFFMLFFGSGIACSPAESGNPADSVVDSHSQFTQMTDTSLSLQFKALQLPALSSGYTFRCTPIDVEGNTGDPFILSVMVADKAIYQTLSSADSARVFSGSFELYKEGVENNVLAITGFVDKKTKKAWLLKDLGD